METQTIDLNLKASVLKQQLKLTTESFPKNTYFLVNLLNRCAVSIERMMIEATALSPAEESKDLFWSVRGRVRECFDLVEVAARQGLIDDPTRYKYRKSLNDLGGMVQDRIRSFPSISKN